MYGHIIERQNIVPTKHARIFFPPPQTCDYYDRARHTAVDVPSDQGVDGATHQDSKPALLDSVLADRAYDKVVASGNRVTGPG